MPEVQTVPQLPELGPFRPPGNLEPEFHAPVPRPIPEALRRGRYGRMRRTALWFTALFAASAYACWWATRGTTLDFYFLALPYFQLVAAGSVVLALVLAVVQQLFPGRYRYVREGIPMPARVRDVRLVVSATTHGSASRYRYSCTVEFQPAGERETRLALVPSPDFSEMFKDATETPLRVGDYVTAVALPGEVDRTVTLYGFLQLNPDLEFVRRKGRKPGHGNAVRDALLYVGLVDVFIGLLLAVTGFPSMLPISLPESADPRWAVPVAVLIAIPGAILTWLWMRRSETRRRADIEARNEAARREGRPVEEFAPVVAGKLNRGVLVLAGAFIPVMVGVLLVSALNAVFDTSPARYEAVAIQDFYHETWIGLFRNYEVRYEREGRSQSIKVPVTQVWLLEIAAAKRGALEWHTGRLGMPWIVNIHPLLVGQDGVERVQLPDGRQVKLQ
jgi:hypothetical protein